MVPLKLDKNPYVAKNLEYFLKRRQNLIDAKFRAIMYKKYEHKCPMCKESLHNGEPIELHHIIPRKSGGKYSIENILPLHQICHQQINHGDRSLERFKIALTPSNSEPKRKRKKRVNQTKSSQNQNQRKNK